MTQLNRITANEARAYLSDDWRKKLNEIYDGVRAMLEIEEDSYAFALSNKTPFTNELVLKSLELDGYRLVKCSDSVYEIYW